MLVAEIWRYPVKSLQGEQLGTATIGPAGLDGDREWGLLDPATGYVLTARREPQLLFASARLVDGAPVLTFDDGTVAADDAALSAWLGRPVQLVRATCRVGPEGTHTGYRCGDHHPCAGCNLGGELRPMGRRGLSEGG